MRKPSLLLLAPLVGLALSPAVAAEAVKINCADAAAIAAGLNGVGDAKAAAIIEYRTANGPFKTVEDLGQVKGMGEKTLENNKDSIDLTATCT